MWTTSKCKLHFNAKCKQGHGGQLNILTAECHNCPIRIHFSREQSNNKKYLLISVISRLFIKIVSCIFFSIKYLTQLFRFSYFSSAAPRLSSFSASHCRMSKISLLKVPVCSFITGVVLGRILNHKVPTELYYTVCSETLLTFITAVGIFCLY